MCWKLEKSSCLLRMETTCKLWNHQSQTERGVSSALLNYMQKKWPFARRSHFNKGQVKLKSCYRKFMVDKLCSGLVKMRRHPCSCRVFIETFVPLHCVEKFFFFVLSNDRWIVQEQERESLFPICEMRTHKSFVRFEQCRHISKLCATTFSRYI